jgi:hypothetical protein
MRQISVLGASLDDYSSVKSTEMSLDASDGNVKEAVANAYNIAIGLDTSLVNVTMQHSGGPTIEVPVEDIPPDPDAKEKLMDAVLESTCQIDHVAKQISKSLRRCQIPPIPIL